MMHAIVAPSSSPADPDLVGVALGGRVTLAADGSMVGRGTESEAGQVNLRADPGDFQPQADGRFVFEIAVDPTTKPDYERGFVAGGTTSVIFGIDPFSAGTDDAGGVVAMLRVRDPAGFDVANLTGTYTLGMWTLFLRPTASGSDAALGTLELKSNGDFELLAQSNTGVDFRYSGTFQAQADGTLTFTVPGTRETWVAAFDQGYDTIVFVDQFKESRADQQIELNLGIALRPMPPSGS
ncbi:MAG: hypothetical protein IPM29_13645 [Planctomycetes bacterium]|nr:hypothetical protein [Planctomycetota bacterium]